MNAFEAVTILVTAATAGIGAYTYLRNGSALADLGRNGTTWFDHISDLPIEQRPSEDERDAPIPRRPF